MREYSMHPPLTEREQFQLDDPLLCQQETFLLSITETFTNAMLQQGLSIDQVAIQCNIPKKHLAQLLSHEKLWTTHLLATIALALGYTPHIDI